MQREATNILFHSAILIYHATCMYEDVPIFTQLWLLSGLSLHGIKLNQIKLNKFKSTYIRLLVYVRWSAAGPVGSKLAYMREF